MAYPPGLVLRGIQTVPLIGVSGKPVTGKLAVVPSTSLKWAADGTVILKQVVTFPLVNGIASGMLPTIQPGLLDSDGNEVDSFAYSAFVQDSEFGSNVPYYAFELVNEPGIFTVDFNISLDVDGIRVVIPPSSDASGFARTANLTNPATAEGAAVREASARPLRAEMKPMSQAVAPVSKVVTRQITPGAPGLAYSAQTGTRWDSPKIRYLSGALTATSGDPNTGGVSKTTGASNVCPMLPAFVLQGDRFSLMMHAAGTVDTQVYIDNEPLWATPQTMAAGYNFIEAQMAAIGTYEVVVVLGNATFIQIVHNTPDTIAPGARRFTIGLFGDSYADVGQAPYFGGLVAELLASTGWGVVPLGQGSTGWAAQRNDPNPENRSPYESESRRAAVAAQDLDALLAIGSINSGDQTPATVAAALETFYAGLQADTPGLPVIIAGVEPYNLGTSQAQVDNNNALRTTSAELGLPFIDWFGEEWMTGVSTLGVPGGTGTQARMIGADGVHLGLAGNVFFAQRFADALGSIRI